MKERMKAWLRGSEMYFLIEREGILGQTQISGTGSTGHACKEQRSWEEHFSTLFMTIGILLLGCYTFDGIAWMKEACFYLLGKSLTIMNWTLISPIHDRRAHRQATQANGGEASNIFCSRSNQRSLGFQEPSNLKPCLFTTLNILLISHHHHQPWKPWPCS